MNDIEYNIKMEIENEHINTHLLHLLNKNDMSSFYQTVNVYYIYAD
jgi:hypothetical protein